MNSKAFPELQANRITATRDALHRYAEVVGSWLEGCRPRRKHWWHISLRPTVRGLSTGLVHADKDFELELDLRDGVLHGQVAGGDELREPLHGQSAADVAKAVQDFLLTAGIATDRVPQVPEDDTARAAAAGYSGEVAADIARAWTSVAGAMASLRAGVREETSPIQLWPHHFDLSMVWLPGELIPGQDPADEEHADKQMNFGFTLGDAGIPEPYFYITAYPEPEAFASLRLPTGTVWHTEGFSGAVLRYRDLLEHEAPEDYLLDLWRGLLDAGRQHLLDNA